MSDVGGNTTATVGDPGCGLDFRLLGSVEVALGASEIPIGSVKQRALLAILVLHLNTVVSADRLIDVLWGEHPPPSALPTLRSLVARLRRTLDTAGVSPAQAVVRGKGAGYLLRAATERVDALRFSVLVEQARHAFAQGQADMAARDLRAALALWRGPALQDLSEWAFAQIEAQRLDEERATAVEDLAEAELALGRPAEALTRLEPLLEAHPLRERGWSQLMVALYRLGRQADALTAYQGVRTVLADELGIDPSPALRELHERILRQSRDLDDIGTVAAGGRSEHRLPSPPLDAVGHNLPAALTSFVGRARELAEVEALLGGARLLTLTGVGGVGKTRLALHWAADALPRYPDGVRLVEFGAIRDPALVVPSVATAVGFILNELQSDGQPPLDGLCRRLATRRLLLILDNCEHLVQPVSQLAHALLTACPNVAVLATSRETLGIPGEVGYQVPPLSLRAAVATGPEQLAAADAVRLFCERARCAEPGFRLTSANAAAVTQICQRLDGIPLALELAAARIRVLGAHQIAERLTHRLRLLAAGARTTEPRHQTLRSTIDWSHQLLAPAEQTLLANLSVFPASFDLDAAEAVNAGVPDPGFETLDLLGRLVDKSLVVVVRDDKQVRYRLLETIREYASEKLGAAGETEATQRRHRDFFVTVAGSCSSELAWAAPIRRAAADLDSFRAAMTWSLAQGDSDALLRLVAMLWPYWATIAGTEGLDWLELAVATTGPAPLSARAEVRAGLGMVLRHRGTDQMSRCFELCAQAVDMATEAGDLNAVGKYNISLWDMALSAGQLDRAERFAHEARTAYEASGSSAGQALPHFCWGWQFIHRRDYPRAHEEFWTAVALDRVHGDDWSLPQTLGAQALASALTGRTEPVERLAREAVEIARRLPTCEILVVALTRAAQASVLSGHPRTAQSVLTELLGLLRDLGFQRWVADALELTAILLVHDQPGQAAALLGAARSLRDSLGESTPTFISDQLERCRRQTVTAIGDRHYPEHEDEGSCMTTHEALACALSALDACQPPEPPARGRPVSAGSHQASAKMRSLLGWANDSAGSSSGPMNPASVGPANTGSVSIKAVRDSRAGAD